MAIRTQRLLPVVLSALVLTSALYGGEEQPLGTKVFGADLIVMIHLDLRGGGRTPGGDSYARVTTALARPVGVDILAGDSSGFSRAVRTVFSASSPCLARAVRKRSLSAVLFFTREKDGSLRQIFGVEQELGHHTDLNPEWAAYQSAVVEARAWMDAVKEGEKSRQPLDAARAALSSSDDIYRPLLAAAFLRLHGAGDVVTREWSREPNRGDSGADGREDAWKAAEVERSGLSHSDGSRAATRERTLVQRLWMHSCR